MLVDVKAKFVRILKPKSQSLMLFVAIDSTDSTVLLLGIPEFRSTEHQTSSANCCGDSADKSKSEAIAIQSLESG